MAALALMTIACSNDDNDIAQQPQMAEGITITATLAPKTNMTRAVADNGDNKITVTWAENEHIAILYTKDETQFAADAEITAVDGSGTATITFTVQTGTPDDTPCTLVYPYSAAKADHSGVKDAATLLAAQDGTLNANLDVRVGAGTIQTTTPGLTVTTQPAAQFAIFKFTTKTSDGSATIDVKPLTITTGGQDYVITPASATSALYAALPAVSGQAVTFTATGSDSKTYMASKASVTFAAGKYYQSTVKMHGFVDLGLSVKWADMNVGAASETARGNYFAWGETTGYAYDSGHDFSEANYSLYDSGTTTLTKYTWDGSTFDYTTLQTADDAVAHSWGGTCRMPTKAEWQELIANCTAEWQTEGTLGVKFTSNVSGYTTKSFFLPATGYYNGTNNVGTNIYACYWSSSLYADNQGTDIEPLYAPTYAWYLDVLYNSGSIYRNQVMNKKRYYGMPVRPVLGN